MEAIVILILAVVMLGLGLTFVRKIFQDIGGNVDEVLDISQVTDMPTAERQITMTPNDLVIKQKDNKETTLAFYNPSPNNKYWIKKIRTPYDDEDCSFADPCYSGGISVLYSKQVFTLEKDDVQAWEVTFQADKNAVQLVMEGIGGTYTTATAEVPALFTIEICAVDTVDDEECSTDNEEIYQKEISLTVKK